MKAGKFISIIRQRYKMRETDSLTFFVNEKMMLKHDTFMSEVYEKQKDIDGFLYIVYTEENT